MGARDIILIPEAYKELIETWDVALLSRAITWRNTPQGGWYWIERIHRGKSLSEEDKEYLRIAPILDAMNIRDGK